MFFYALRDSLHILMQKKGIFQDDCFQQMRVAQQTFLWGGKGKNQAMVDEKARRKYYFDFLALKKRLAVNIPA